MEVIMSSAVQNCSGMENGRGDVSAGLHEYQEKKKRKLLRRKYTENPESKLEVARQNVDMMPQSSIQDNPNTDLGTTATVQLSKRQIRRNRKLLRDAVEKPEIKLEVARRNFVIITQSSIWDSPNTDLGTTATVELSKRQIRRNRKLLEREDTENPESKLEVACQNVDMIAQSSIQGNLNTDLGTTATVELSKRQIRRNRKLLKRKDTENPESKLEVARQNVDMITQSSIQGNPNTDLGTPATVVLSKRQIRRNRKLLEREDTKNPESILEVAPQNADMITQSSIQGDSNTDLGTTATAELSKRKIRRNRKLLKREDTENRDSKLEVAPQNVDMITQSSIQGDPNAHLGTTATVELSKRQERRNRKLLEREDTKNRESKLEVAPQNVDMITQSSIQDNANADLGTTATVELSKCQERRNRKLLKREDTENRESKLEVAPQNVEMITQSSIQDNANTDLGTTETVELSKHQERRNRKLLKREDTENSEMGANICMNVHVEGTIQKKKKKKSRRKKPTLDETLNPQQLEDMEVAIGETDSGTTATDNTVSKKRKRQKLENKNPASGDILGTRVCIQDTPEPASGESVSCKTATPDVKIVSKGKEHTKDANGKKGSSKMKNQKRHEQETKRRKPTLGEILNPQYLQNLEAGNIVLDSKSSAKKKRQKLKKKATKGELLTTSENTQDSVIAKKNTGTNEVLEATSTESKREDNMEIVNGEKCLRTTPLDMKTVSKREEHIGSSGNTTIDAKTVSKVEDSTGISRKTEKLINKEGEVCLTATDVIPHFPTSGKKLVVFDVNGLLADIVSPRPKDAKADIYIPKRAIFKRPFLDDFLCFCFERFHVGIWSSRTKRVLDPVVNFLLGDFKNKLLFLWDASSCTNSGMKTLEDRYKPIVFKDLRKIWERNGPGKSWVKGTYNESNTLLLDDSPYKALLNPKHTGIFPVSYSYKNKNDNFLGPTGVLRSYLEGVAATDNLKMYVEQHPFGQGFIDEENPDWSFYSRALKSTKHRYW